MPEVKVAIEGMSCSSCSYKIECEVGDLPGVTGAKVDLAAKQGTFDYEASNAAISPDAIVAKINELGFKAKLVSSHSFSDLKIYIFAI